MIFSAWNYLSLQIYKTISTFNSTGSDKWLTSLWLLFSVGSGLNLRDTNQKPTRARAKEDDNVETGYWLRRLDFSVWTATLYKVPKGLTCCQQLPL